MRSVAVETGKLKAFSNVEVNWGSILTFRVGYASRLAIVPMETQFWIANGRMGQ